MSELKKDRSRSVYGNPVVDLIYNNAVRTKNNYIKKFGDGSGEDYSFGICEDTDIGDLTGALDIRPHRSQYGSEFDHENGLIIGSILNSYDGCRTAAAIAACAHRLGYVPYLMDMAADPEGICTKVIEAQEKAYSFNTKLIKNPILTKAVWEPMNNEGLKSIGYNAADQKCTELMAKAFEKIPKDIPFLGTHAWAAQAAVHAGMNSVVNAVPGNCPEAVDLAEGAVHTVQTREAYIGYRVLNGMDGQKVLRPIPEEELIYTGHYVDPETVMHIDKDCDARMARKKEGQPIRFFLQIGEDGRQKDVFIEIIRHLMPLIKRGNAALFVNAGTCGSVWDDIKKEFPHIEKVSREHFNDWDRTVRFSKFILNPEKLIRGIHVFYHDEIMRAAYTANLLMRGSDVLITEPGELSFYPIPKLFIKRNEKQEMYAAAHSAACGDGTMECRDIPHVLQMVDLFARENYLLEDMCGCIKAGKRAGLYDGGLKAAELAMSMKKVQTTVKIRRLHEE